MKRWQKAIRQWFSGGPFTTPEHAILWLFALVALLALPSAATAQSNDGVYGGYVGSTDWFRAMRQSAQNQAMLRALGAARPGRGRAAVPPGYVEVGGVIRFRDGQNPFPGGRLPDLRIMAVDSTQDPVERAPFLAEDGSFYTVLKRGLAYEVRWMYYFGGKETWAHLEVDPTGPPRETLELLFPVAEEGDEGPAPPVAPTDAPPVPEPPQPPAPEPAPPPVGPTPQEPQPGPGYRPPAVGPGYRPPAIGPGYQPPRTDRKASERAAPETRLEKPADADRFDTSGLPSPPQTFRQQQLWEEIRGATTPALKAIAHEKLADYYQAEGRAALAAKERLKAEYWKRVVQ